MLPTEVGADAGAKKVVKAVDVSAHGFAFDLLVRRDVAIAATQTHPAGLYTLFSYN